MLPTRANVSAIVTGQFGDGTIKSNNNVTLEGSVRYRRTCAVTVLCAAIATTGCATATHPTGIASDVMIARVSILDSNAHAVVGHSSVRPVLGYIPGALFGRYTSIGVMEPISMDPTFR